MSSYRRSGYDYPSDDYRGGERWDRDRFDRMSGRSRGSRGGGSSFRYEEDDRYYDRGPAGGGRGSRVEVFEESRGNNYDDRYYDDERYSTPRRSRPAYLDEDRYQVSNREVAPYRPRYDRGYDGYDSRRRSSVDSYDRRPPRYEQEREDINVNLNVRSPPPPPPPPQPTYSYNYKSRPEYYEEDDEYEDIRIRRERERSTYRRYDDHDDNNDSYEPQSPQSSSYKRGRTRMPKRLVHRSAIIQKGYPFEEETDFYIVRIALRKDQIDEIIKISESYFHEEKLSVTISEKKALPAPEPAKDSSPEPAQEEVVETVTTKVIENPTEEDLEKYGKAGDDNNSSNSDDGGEENHSSHHSSHHHSKSQSQSRSTHVSKKSSSKAQQSNLSPTTTHQSHRDRSSHRGRSHSRAKNMELVAERDSSSSSDEKVTTTTLPDRSRDDEVEIVRVEKDSGGRGQFVASRSDNNTARSRSRRRPSQKVVNAALYSLT